MTLIGLAFAFSANSQVSSVQFTGNVVAPEIPKGVLFDQSAITNSGFPSTFSNQQDVGIYLADDFELLTPANITSITAFGFQNPQTFNDITTGINLYIYANSTVNTPDGDPTQPGSGLLELVNLDPTGSAVEILSPSPGLFNIRVDIEEAFGSNFVLPPGDYWLVVTPSMDVPAVNAADNWFWFGAGASDVGVDESQAIAPRLGFNDWIPSSVATNGDPGSAAFIIEGDVVGDFAKVQIVHNAPDPSASVVDIYVNGDLAIDDFEFRTATSFLPLPAGVDLDLDVAPGTSADVSESLFTATVNLAIDETYIVVASGVLDPTLFDDSVNAIAFSLEVFVGAREASAVAGNTDVLVQHGSPDAPAVDVVNQDGGGVLVDDISYPQFQGYLELATLDYLLDVELADNSSVVASYLAPLQTLGLSDLAITVLASGFLNPTNNQNGAEFGLWVALPSGGDLVELPLQTLSNESFNSFDFTYYPNPVNDILSISTASTVDNIKVYNMLGQMVVETAPKVSNPQVDMNELQSGVYLVTLEVEGSLQTFRVIKQ
ncbi:DUF4397 domain-containing protein [Psychroflexus gondwanensis]|uniref:DUF4397 domain-containing protein n=1 Tax=Psychroflexus gondwanensis TaxID=251 RepID=UPI00039BF76F|nr:DUF4397 domain-containing protein [Psychroflexus gondwanensis]